MLSQALQSLPEASESEKTEAIRTLEDARKIRHGILGDVYDERDTQRAYDLLVYVHAR